MTRWIVACLALVLGAVSISAAAQDYAREKRWADEVVPDLVVGDAVWLRQSNGHEFLGLYTAAKNPKAAVLMVHGMGVQPNFSFFGMLRVTLADAGYTTLSIQMPVLAAGAGPSDYYPKLFPDAIERIRLGASWLAGKGYTRIVLLSHSMGSWMSQAYFAATPDAPFAAWICLGRSGAFDGLKNVRVPVLDVYGDHDLPAVLRTAAERRAAIARLPRSSQVMIRGADHFYNGKESELEHVVTRFLAHALPQK